LSSIFQISYLPVSKLTTHHFGSYLSESLFLIQNNSAGRSSARRRILQGDVSTQLFSVRESYAMANYTSDVLQIMGLDGPFIFGFLIIEKFG
jgi:hypothetical protein